MGGEPFDPRYAPGGSEGPPGPPAPPQGQRPPEFPPGMKPVMQPPEAQEDQGIAPQPLPLHIVMGIVDVPVRTEDGGIRMQRVVKLMSQSVAGASFMFMAPDEAKEVAKQLWRNAALADTSLTVIGNITPDLEQEVEGEMAQGLEEAAQEAPTEG